MSRSTVTTGPEPLLRGRRDFYIDLDRAGHWTVDHVQSLPGINEAVISAIAGPGHVDDPVAAHLKGSEISIGVDLGLGDGRATVWTCDLTHGYISINADYRS